MDHPSLARERSFWTHVQKDGECWLWTGALWEKGYGKLRWGSRWTTAHRVAFALVYGPIPEGLLVCHRCDVRACANPAHLFLGTAVANNADRDAKGRQAKGERHGFSKLTVTAVREIRAQRAAGNTLRSIATRYSIDPRTVHSVATRLTWAWLP